MPAARRTLSGLDHYFRGEVMSRVFVSCAYRDRAVGERLESLVRSLGHDSADDRDDSKGTAWWNEVVGRIEASDVFVAVASPAYAEAQACRLEAKHAAATGLPVVRVDLDDQVAADCHPVVAHAVGVPFAPEDPEAVVQLAQALMGSPPDVGHDTTAAAAATRQVTPEQDPGSDPPELDRTSSRLSGIEVMLVIAMVLSAIGLLVIGLSMLVGSEPSTRPVSGSTASAQPGPSGTSTPGTGVPTPGEAAAALLAGVEGIGSPRLPVGSCQAGADAVTCTNPAPNIRTVVMTPYQTPAKLYAAYAADVESLSGEPIDENTGNCSMTESEGEIGWNLDQQHTLDYSVAEQEQGGLDPVSESAGRAFCTDEQKVMTLVWTQDPGLLVTATGQPSELVITWWKAVHLQLACASGVDAGACAATGS